MVAVTPSPRAWLVAVDGFPMPAQLLSLTEGPNILLDKPILLLGRHPECDVQIDSRKISRRHCCIAQVSDYLVVRDLGSTNGVRINGERVNEGKLAPGDELIIGTFRYRVVWDSISRPAINLAPAPLRGSAGPGTADDALLDECDEPVPLPEPKRMGHHCPAHPLDKNSGGRDEALLPENLDLIPPSEIFPRPSGN